MTQNLTRSMGETSCPLIPAVMVSTERAACYGRQLVSHTDRKITGSWDEETSSGCLLFDHEGPVLGCFDVIMSASDLELELRTKPEHADRLEFVVGIHLAYFGARDSFVISWERTDGNKGPAQGPLILEEVEVHARARKVVHETEHEATEHEAIDHVATE